MYWHAQGVKTEYSGTVTLDGEEYVVLPEKSYGYADKNWGSDFTKGGRLINDAFGSIGNAFGKNIHPKVRKAAKKTIKRAVKYVSDSYISGQLEDWVCGGIDWFASKYTNAYFGLS